MSNISNLSDLSGNRTTKQLQMNRKATAKRRKIAKKDEAVRKLTAAERERARAERERQKAERAQMNKERAALKEMRDKAATRCKNSRKRIAEKYAELYKKYPKLAPKPAVPPQTTGEQEISCSNPQYKDCRTKIYVYPNGDQRIVTWERKKPKKATQKKMFSKGVADCGCRI